MSVASRNPFALLDAEDSSRPASPGPNKQAASTPSAPAPASRGQQKTRGGPASRGGKYYARGGKPAPKDGSAAPAGDDAPAAEGQRKFEGGRGGRGGRGRGGPRGGGGRGRAYDRHSATGKTDSHKKVHQGWGGDEPNTELKQEQAASADAAAEATPAEWGSSAPTADWGAPAPTSSDWGAPAPTSSEWGPAGGDGAANEGAHAESKPRKREEEEEEDNTLTLDQYLAKQKEAEPTVPKIETTRQANEGAGDIWKDVVALAKNEEEESYFVGKSKAAPKSKAKKEEKVYLEIDARFERPDRGGRGRGRGGDRGAGGGGERRSRGRGGPRGGRQNGGNTAPNVDDQTAFPSLA